MMALEVTCLQLPHHSACLFKRTCDTVQCQCPTGISAIIMKMMSRENAEWKHQHGRSDGRDAVSSEILPCPWL